MDHHARGAIERIYRRIMLMVAPARVTLVDDTGRVQKVQAKISVNEVMDGVPRLAEFGLASNPPVGSDCVVLFVSGDRSNPVVLATGNQATRPGGLLPGEVVIYDAFGKSIYLTQSSGIVINANGQNVTVNNAPTTTLNGNLVVDGAISATGEISSGSHTLTQHVHGGVQAGSSNTAKPTG